MSFCKGMKQPLADLQLLQPETKETASELILWHISEDPKHVRRRCTTGTDEPCGDGENKVKHNIWWQLARTSSIEQDTCATNKIVKS